jgi:hypothetical protein
MWERLLQMFESKDRSQGKNSRDPVPKLVQRRAAKSAFSIRAPALQQLLLRFNGN